MLGRITILCKEISKQITGDEILKVVTHTLKQGIMETCLNFYIDG
jgi:hypothetical protein